MIFIYDWVIFLHNMFISIRYLSDTYELLGCGEFYSSAWQKDLEFKGVQS